MIAPACPVPNCINGPTLDHQMSNTCGVMCRTENCVNGPEPHVFELDVERPVDAQPDRCQPAEWVNRPRPLSAHVEVDRNGADLDPTAVPHVRPLSADHAARVAGSARVRSAINVRPLRDDPITTNAEGGSQSVIEESFTTLPLRALRAIAQLQRLGDQKYGAHNWRKILEVDHLDHAFAHMLGYCQNDVTEDHLLHAAWRLLAALEQQLAEREKRSE